MKELVIRKNGVARQKENNYLDERIFRQRLNNWEQVRGYFNTLVTSYNDFKQCIKSEEVYVVKFTQEQLKKFQNGEIDFQKTADGKSLLPNFVVKGTNNEIVSKARLEKILLENQDGLQNTLGNVNQLANAQKMAQLELLLLDIKQLGLEIKQGQKDDRRAKILGAEETINQALQMSDDNPHREFLILNSIVQLNEGREALIKEFESEVNRQISIPNSWFLVFFKSVFDDKFSEEVEHSYFELNDQFSYIVKASDLLGKIYLLTGHSNVIDTVYSPVKKIVENNHEYVSSLIELQDLNSEEQQRQMRWVLEHEDFIEQIGQVELVEEDTISIEFTGEELLNGDNL